MRRMPLSGRLEKWRGDPLLFEAGFPTYLKVSIAYPPTVQKTKTVHRGGERRFP